MSAADRFYAALDRIDCPPKAATGRTVEEIMKDVGPAIFGTASLKYRLVMMVEDQREKLTPLEDLVGSEDVAPEALSEDDFDKHKQALATLEGISDELMDIVGEATLALNDAKEEWHRNRPVEEFQGYNKPSDYL